MIDLTFNFKNPLEISVLDGESGDVKETLNTENSISDDFLVGFQSLYTKNCDFTNYMYLALVPDGALWSGWTWNPRDPWVPYTLSDNRTSDPLADTTYAASKTVTWDAPNKRWKLFYQWTKLQANMNLKAVGLISCDYAGTAINRGICDNYTSFPMFTLAVLPSAIPVKGRVGGTQVPDILQISYYFSVIGV